MCYTGYGPSSVGPVLPEFTLSLVYTVNQGNLYTAAIQ